MLLSHVRIIGSGLIGTSIGLGLVQRGISVSMVDVDPAAQALAQDLMKSAPNTDPDLVLLASPLGSLSEVLKGLDISNVKFGFMDIGSVKTKVKVEVSASNIPVGSFLPSHPMAGREVGGAHSARADLFEGRPWIIDSHGANPQLVSAGRELIETLGATVIDMDSSEHDQAVALVSHLPQIVASLLAGQLVGVQPQWLNLAGAGLRDTIRISGSSPDLWKEIITANRDSIIPLLQNFISEANDLLKNIDNEDYVAEAVVKGTRGKSAIPGKHGGKQREYTYLPIVIEDKPGQLAALFDECAKADVNVEDLAIEHSPGQFTGLITLALSESDAVKLAEHLKKNGWSVHAQR